MSAHRIATLLSLTWLAACASTPEPPKPQSYSLGLSQASYREYGKKGAASICAAEPNWLMDELVSVNSVLRRFVELEPQEGASWTPEGLSTLEKAEESLPSVVQTHQDNLDALAHCGFANERVFPQVAKDGHALVERARSLLSRAPGIVDEVNYARALTLWQEERVRQERLSRGGCPKRIRPGYGDLYFAYRDEKGVTRYLFCDGATVEAAPGEKPRFEPPARLTGAALRRVRPQRYLQQAKLYPDATVSQAPPRPKSVTESPATDVAAKP